MERGGSVRGEEGSVAGALAIQYGGILARVLCTLVLVPLVNILLPPTTLSPPPCDPPPRDPPGHRLPVEEAFRSACERFKQEGFQFGCPRAYLHPPDHPHVTAPDFRHCPHCNPPVHGQPLLMRRVGGSVTTWYVALKCCAPCCAICRCYTGCTCCTASCHCDVFVIPHMY